MVFWDPQPIAWTLPGVELPIAWYGVLFVAGFFGATVAGRRLLQEEGLREGLSLGAAAARSRIWMDQLTTWSMAGVLVGARLCHCLFYDPLYYLQSPLAILALREGGLASHGGILGLALALLWLARRERISTWIWWDLVGAVYAIPAVAIRLGNFMNQEIIGTPTGGEWGVIFGHPADGSTLVPRHPVQLYEALAYALLGVFAWRTWRRGARLGSGQLAGLGLLSAFGVRFLLEWLKEEQAQWSPAGLTLGQWLSIPCIVIGWWMLTRRPTPRTLTP